MSTRLHKVNEFSFKATSTLAQSAPASTAGSLRVEDGSDRMRRLSQLRKSWEPFQSPDGRFFDHFLVVGAPPHAHSLMVQASAEQAASPQTPRRHRFRASVMRRLRSNRDAASTSTASEDSSILSLERQFSPQILYSFPEEETVDIPELAHFCFPEATDAGVPAYTVLRSQSASAINELRYSMTHLYSRENAFIFLLSGDDDNSVLYGCVLRSPELVDQPPAFISRSEGSRRVSAADGDANEPRERFATVSQRVYCFITRYPFFRLHFDVLYGVMARELEMRIAQDLDAEARPADFADSNAVMDLLAAYQAMQLPRSGTTVSIAPESSPALRYTCPVGTDLPASLVADWTSVDAMRLLGCRLSLRLLAAALLERKIVVVGSNIGLVSSVVLSIWPMLRPFVWQCSFVSVLPMSLVDFVDSPVPGVFGVAELPSGWHDANADAVVVRIVDDTAATVEITTPLPELPATERLTKELVRGFEMLCDTSTPRPHMESYLIVMDILAILSAHLRAAVAWWESALPAHEPATAGVGADAGADPVPASLKAKFLASRRADDLPFLERFVETQMFAAFCDEVGKRGESKLPTLSE